MRKLKNISASAKSAITFFTKLINPIATAGNNEITVVIFFLYELHQMHPIIKRSYAIMGFDPLQADVAATATILVNAEIIGYAYLLEKKTIAWANKQFTNLENHILDKIADSCALDLPPLGLKF